IEENAVVRANLSQVLQRQAVTDAIPDRRVLAAQVREAVAGRFLLEQPQGHYQSSPYDHFTADMLNGRSRTARHRGRMYFILMKTQADFRRARPYNISARIDGAGLGSSPSRVCTAVAEAGAAISIPMDSVPVRKDRNPAGLCPQGAVSPAACRSAARGTSAAGQSTFAREWARTDRQ